MSGKTFFALGLLFFSLLAQAAPIQGEDLLTGKPEVVDTKGKKATVAVFLSSECPCSNSHIAILKKLAADYPDFAFVGVHANANEPVAGAKAYFQAQGLPFPVLEDGNETLANQYKAFKTPHAFVIASDGKVLYKGGVTNSATGPSATKQYLRDALADLEAGRAVKVAETRTLGCMISRSK